MQRVETVEDCNDERRRHHQNRNEIEWLSELVRLWIELHRVCPQRSNRSDEEAEYHDRSDGQRRNVDRTVLPQFTPQRPVHSSSIHCVAPCVPTTEANKSAARTAEGMGRGDARIGDHLGLLSTRG